MTAGLQAAPPSDLPLEVQTLGSALHSADRAREVAALGPELFSTDGHRALLAAIQTIAPSLNGEPPSATLVAATARADGASIDAVLVAEALEEGISVFQLDSHLAALRELAAQREEFAVTSMLHFLHERGGSGRDADLWADVQARLERARTLRATATLAATPQLRAIRDVLGERFPERAAIVGRGVIPRAGIALLIGRPKLGKSGATSQLAIAREEGLYWLGFPVDAAGRTAIFDAELGPEAFQQRVRLQLPAGLELSDRIQYIHARGLKLDAPDGLAAILGLVQEADADLIVFDPLARLMAGDENSTRDMSRVVDALDRIVRTTGAAILVLHHSGKPRAEDPRDGGHLARGSSVLYAAADSVMVMDRAGEGQFKISFELRHGRELEPLLLERRPEDFWLVPAGPREEVLAVARVLGTAGLPWKAAMGAIEGDLEVSRKTAERRLKEALQARTVVKDADGLYRQAVSNPHGNADGEVSHGR